MMLSVHYSIFLLQEETLAWLWKQKVCAEGPFAISSYHGRPYKVAYTSREQITILMPISANFIIWFWKFELWRRCDKKVCGQLERWKFGRAANHCLVHVFLGYHIHWQTRYLVLSHANDFRYVVRRMHVMFQDCIVICTSIPHSRMPLCQPHAISILCLFRSFSSYLVETGKFCFTLRG